MGKKRKSKSKSKLEEEIAEEFRLRDTQIDSLVEVYGHNADSFEGDIFDYYEDLANSVVGEGLKDQIIFMIERLDVSLETIRERLNTDAQADKAHARKLETR